MTLQICALGCVCLWRPEQHGLLLCFISLQVHFLRQCLSLNLEHAVLAGLAGQGGPGTHVSPVLWCGFCTHLLSWLLDTQWRRLRGSKLRPSCLCSTGPTEPSPQLHRSHISKSASFLPSASFTECLILSGLEVLLRRKR